MALANTFNAWTPAEPDAIQCLQIVYKIAERCNLNCSYCYYYNMGDDTALSRPARASLDTSEALAQWLAQGCSELGIPQVSIAFHGGEPMLVRAAEFARICAAFERHLGEQVDLRFSIQTNGTLLTEGWIEALRHYRVSIGISIDGMEADHDRFRLDHQGRSTFAETEAAIARLVSESSTAPSIMPGTISVVDHRVDYAATYRYLRGLGVRTMHFLLPDRSADDASPATKREAERIGQGLLDLFRAWLDEDDPDVTVRFIREALAHFELGDHSGLGATQRKKNQILVARSDGTVAIDDSLIPALDWYSSVGDFPIATHSLRDVFRAPVFAQIEQAEHTLPDACAGCSWTGLCRGGDLENRFARATGFNNPSVYCDTYKTLYAGICETLITNGYPAHQVEARFGELQYA
jgi:uncharacterized protein